jgi:non-heme chloroperoxidase
MAMLFSYLIAALNLVAPITEGTTTVGPGVTIHYLQSGPAASSKALVLIPGWRLPAYLWTEQLNTFGASMRVIAIDPRSQGPSTKTTEGNSPEGRAADLHTVLSNLGIAHATLVGWSQGAQDVAAYLGAYGTAGVDGVVFVDSPVSYGPAEVDAHPVFAKIILGQIPTYAAHPAEYSKGMVQSIFSQPHPDLDMNRIVQSTMATPPDIGVAMLTMDIFGADRRVALRKLDKPALVIASAKSPLLDEQKEMASIIPNAHFVAIDNTAHAVMVDQPAQFDSALTTFLATENRGASAADVCQIENDVDAAVVNRDRDALSHAFADEYEHIDFRGGTTPRAGELTFLTAGELIVKGASTDGCRVQFLGDLAIATGITNWTGATYRGVDLSGSYRFSRVYAMRSGHWQIVESHASKIAAQSAGNSSRSNAS